jgi:mannosyl-glycoprotein endo-beta-N-acetylglucosaminidase
MGGGVAQAATPINVAQGKPATSLNVPCSLGSLPGKAVDGKAANIYTDKWCAHGILGGATLTVDLGNCYVVHEIGLRHAGAAGESPAYNTRAYSIRVGDGGSWWTIATVTDNTANSTSHPVPTGKCSRFIQLHVTRPTQNSSAVTRVYELEAWTFSGQTGVTTGNVVQISTTVTTPILTCNNNVAVGLTGVAGQTGVAVDTC